MSFIVKFGRGEAFWPTLFSIAVLVLASKALPLIQKGYSPIEPPRKTSDSGVDPEIGSLAPNFLRARHFPLIIAIHTECQTCTNNPSRVTSELMDDPEILGVVSIVSKSDFRKLFSAEKVDRLIEGDGSFAVKMNAYFTGRIYVYDKNKRLAYIQPFGSTIWEAKQIWKKLPTI